MRKLLTGLLVGISLGVFSASFFTENFDFWTALTSKFTIASSITGVCCAILANILKWDIGIVLGSVLLGIVVFYLKYKITGHHHDPIMMGSFNGVVFGSIFSLILILRRRRLLRKKSASI